MMSDNVVKSSDLPKVENPKPVKKAASVKAVAKTVKEDQGTKSVKVGHQIIIFESGASYTSNDVNFSRDNYIQEVDNKVAELLLTLGNFRRPETSEIESYLNSKEN